MAIKELKIDEEILRASKNLNEIGSYMQSDAQLSTDANFVEAFAFAAAKVVKLIFSITEETVNEASEFTQLAMGKVQEHLNQMSDKYSYNSKEFDNCPDSVCIAELYLAALQVSEAAYSCIRDRTLSSFARSAYKVGSAYQIFKKCFRALSLRKSWETEVTRKHFEGITHVITGVLYFSLAMVPSKLMMFLKYFGYPGSYKLGVEEITIASKIGDPLTSLLCSMLFIMEISSIEMMYGIANIDFDRYESCLKTMSELVPDSSLFKAYNAGYYVLRGKPEEAIKILNAGAFPKEVMKHIHFLYCACYAMQYDFDNVLPLLDNIVRDQFKLAMLNFFKATTLAMCLEKHPEMKEEVCKAMKETINSPKQIFAGRGMFLDQISQSRAKYWCKRNGYPLPFLEVVYSFNFFRVVGTNKAVLKPYFEAIDKHLQKENLSIDDYAYLVFHKAALKAGEGEQNTAIDYFEEILSLEKELKHEKHLVPQACFEIGVIWNQRKNHGEMMHWFKKARTYKNYATKKMINYRMDNVVAKLELSWNDF